MSLAVALGLFLQVGGAQSVILDRARLSPTAEVSFHATVTPETVYVGDAVVYELGVFIPEEVRQRLRKNPEFIAAELRQVLAYDLREGRGPRPLVREGRTYEVHLFRRALFPVSPGKIVVPPAKLSYSIPSGSSFFSREETKQLRSEPVTFVAIAPPAAGRPANWSGAVGNLRLSVSAGAGRTRVGDPFVVTVRVSGEANVQLLPRPSFSLPWASVVPSAERVMVDTMAPVVRGTKEFDFLVTPTVDGREELPPIEYSFFDPSSKSYRVARSASTTVTIGEGSLATVDTMPTTGRGNGIPLIPAWTRALPDSPDTMWWYWIVAIIVPVPAIATLVRERPKKRVRTVPVVTLEKLAHTGSSNAAEVRRALHDALHSRLGAASIPWADSTGVRKALRRHGVTDETIRDALALFDEIDNAAFGTAAMPLRDGAKRALTLYERIDDEARGMRRPMNIKKSAASVAAFFLMFTIAQAQTEVSPRTRFERGMIAAREGQPASAATDFLEAARAEPGVASAWLNAGTASWAAGDTARAVVGWQRALRLDPLDTRPRDLLGRIGADAGAGNDAVWPIPRRIPGWIALALWVGGWIAIWRNKRRRIAAGVVAAALAVSAVSVIQHMRLTDPRVAVMASPAPLRSLPALGADAGAMPLNGELLTVLDRRGLWVYVRASGDREGWLDAARVIDLNANPLRN